MKEFSAAVGTSIAALGFQLTNLTAGITQGTNANQRIGNKIRIKSVEVTGWFTNAPAVPLTATLFNSKSVAAFTTSDFIGPFVYEDSGTNYAHAISDNAGASTFKFVKRFTGLGKEQTYDKDSGVPTHHSPALLINNPGGAALSPVFYYRIRYYDL